MKRKIIIAMEMTKIDVEIKKTSDISTYINLINTIDVLETL